MKFLSQILMGLMLIACVSCFDAPYEPAFTIDDGGVFGRQNGNTNAGEWWVATTNTAGSSNVYLYAPGQQTAARTLQISAEVGAVNALAYDGTDLWVATNSGIYELDRESGVVKTNIAQSNVQGLAFAHNSLWYVANDEVFTLNGATGTSEFIMALNTNQPIADIAVSEHNLMVVDSNQGEVKQFDLNSKQEFRQFFTGIPEVTNLAAANGSFVIITGFDAFCAFNEEDGIMFNDVPIDLPGIVTGVAPTGPAF